MTGSQAEALVEFADIVQGMQEDFYENMPDLAYCKKYMLDLTPEELIYQFIILRDKPKSARSQSSPPPRSPNPPGRL